MNKIKMTRMNCKIKQTDLARQLGVSQSALSAWETGRNEPDNKALRRMSEIFGCTVDELIEIAPSSSHLVFDTSYRTSHVIPIPEPPAIPENAWLLDAYDSAPAHIRRIVDVALEPYKDTNE